MFYEPDNDDHGLPFNPFKSIVVPRPIGWISTVSRDGIVNLAPYSQFNNLGYDPPYVMFSANSLPDTGRRKDSVRNATDTGEFVVNMATYELREAVNITSQLVSPGIDEAALAGLEMIPSRMVKPPRVAASPVHLECRFHSALALPGNASDQVHHVVIGRRTHSRRRPNARRKARRAQNPADRSARVFRLHDGRFRVHNGSWWAERESACGRIGRQAEARRKVRLIHRPDPAASRCQ